jgi:tetrahydrodipicolinate N-succinyltransferase
MMSYEVPARFTDPFVAPIRIGRHAVVGTNCVVLPGCTLGDGAVVGALSLVKADLEPWSVHAGIPARLLRPRSRNVLLLERSLRGGAAPGADVAESIARGDERCDRSPSAIGAGPLG